MPLPAPNVDFTPPDSSPRHVFIIEAERTAPMGISIDWYEFGQCFMSRLLLESDSDSSVESGEKVKSSKKTPKKSKPIFCPRDEPFSLPQITLKRFNVYNQYFRSAYLRAGEFPPASNCLLWQRKMIESAHASRSMGF
ncbi:MAG: hypothetical protein AAFZ63_08055 [Bacteroidota bacterium]